MLSLIRNKGTQRRDKTNALSIYIAYIHSKICIYIYILNIYILVRYFQNFIFLMALPEVIYQMYWRFKRVPYEFSVVHTTWCTVWIHIWCKVLWYMRAFMDESNKTLNVERKSQQKNNLLNKGHPNIVQSSLRYIHTCTSIYSCNFITLNCEKEKNLLNLWVCNAITYAYFSFNLAKLTATQCNFIRSVQTQL